MCGLAGLLDIRGNTLEMGQVVRDMCLAIKHRGPDDNGFYFSGPVALGFQRLSIIDIETGHQPISNEDETVWVMLNGEIYNYLELRQELLSRGHHFKTQSDTEVIAHLYEEYGIDFPKYLRGMFMIVLWDEAKQQLFLSRDRLGEKPLYYGFDGSVLAFSSELKALLSYPALGKKLDKNALHHYLTFSFIPSSYSIIEGIKKLPPAHIMQVDCRTGNYHLEQYWQADPTPDYSISENDYIEKLKEVLDEAVRIRLRSDVPLGAFLSGGIDSSIIVALMTEHLEKVQSFSIGFHDKAADETPFAEEIARYLGTEHRTEYADLHEMSPEKLKNMVWYMDEPFGDSSFIPTYYLSEITAKAVTVSLSGDGADELFGGYTRYRNFQRVQAMQALSKPLLELGANTTSGIHQTFGQALGGLSSSLRQLSKAFHIASLKDNQQLLAMRSFLTEEEKKNIYTDSWYSSTKLEDTVQIYDNLGFSPRELNPLLQFVTSDLFLGLPDDCLVKVDRASMAHGLEVRAPFLDHVLVELALKIPLEYKINKTGQKDILKKAFSALLPQDFTKTRKKHGFEIPFAKWFQNDAMRSFLLDTLSEERIKRQGIFKASNLLHLRDTFLNNPNAEGLNLSAYQLHHRLWSLLILHIWMDLHAI